MSLPLPNTVYKSLFEHNPDGIYMLNVDGTFRSINQAALNITGYSREELINKSFYPLLPPDYLERTKELLSKVLKGESLSFETVVIGKCGQSIHMYITAAPVYEDGMDEVAAVVGIGKDITNLIRNEQALRESELGKSVMVQSALDCIIIMDHRGLVIEFNPAAEATFGYTKEAVIGKPLDELIIPPRLRAHHKAGMKRYLLTGQTSVVNKRIEILAMRSDGSEFPAELTVTCVYQGDHPVFIGFIRDITQSKKMEEELISREVFLQALTVATTSLLTNDSYEVAITEATKVLGEALRIDRLFLCEYNLQNGYHLYYQWNTEKCGDETRGLELCLTDLSRKSDTWHMRMEQGETVKLSAAEPDPHMKCQSQCIFHMTSTVLVPVFVKGRYWGFVAFADSERARSWTQMEESTMVTGAASIVGAVYKKQNEQEIILSRERAEKASLEKSAFLSRMSHELRTPMNAIIGFSQLLEMSELTDTQAKDVKEVLKASNHLLELINELLDLARIEAGKVQLSMSSVHVTTLLNDSITLIQPLKDARKIKITVDTTDLPSEIYIHADETRVKQVLLNLLSNAIKYNRPDGEVRLSCRVVDGKRIRFVVEDTGVGMRQEDLETIFQPFARLKNTQAEEGTGVGLTITQLLVQLMGGSMGVESAWMKGSLFWVEFNQEFPHTTIYPQTLTVSQNELLADSGIPFTVLYIEDNLTNVKLVKNILSRFTNLVFESAPNAEEGFKLLIRGAPDLLLMDIHLPGMDGYEAIKIIKRIPTCAALPIIAVSANAMTSDIALAYTNGFDDYITKPIVIPDFLALINRYMKSKKRSR